jgi:hypothetical protein
MNAPITITGTCAVWLNEFHTPAEILDYLDAGNTCRALDVMCFYGSPELEKFSSYARIGEAQVTVTLLPRDKQTAMAVQALNAKLQELRAAYQQKQQEIMDQISRLQAIEYVSEA